MADNTKDNKTEERNHSRPAEPPGLTEKTLKAQKEKCGHITPSFFSDFFAGRQFLPLNISLICMFFRLLPHSNIAYNLKNGCNKLEKVRCAN